MRVGIKDVIKAVRSALRAKVEGIHPEEVFRAFLKHERAVTERNSLCVTVLAFYSTNGCLGSNTAQLLGSVLAVNVRATDVAGWLDSRTIGVILPNTSVENAALVAKRISDKLSANGVSLPYKFYLYPDEECDKSAGQLGGQHLPESPDRDLSSGTGSSPSGIGNSNHSGDARQQIGRYPLVELCALPLAVWKRWLDIVVCLAALVLVGPLMLLIAAGIKLVSPGPVLFRQERIGFKGKRFVLFKFRSMKLNAETTSHKEYLIRLMQSTANLKKLDKSDARLIPFGRIFRSSGLDELPQLFNILLGDMTLVGPRPCVQYEYEKFSPWHKKRFDVYPGLTGLWQVSGKNKTTFTEMMRLDIAYGFRQTLMRDISILARTFSVVVGQIRESKRE